MLIPYVDLLQDVIYVLEHLIGGGQPVARIAFVKSPQSLHHGSPHGNLGEIEAPGLFLVCGLYLDQTTSENTVVEGVCPWNT